MIIQVIFHNNNLENFEFDRGKKKTKQKEKIKESAYKNGKKFK